LSLEKSHSTGIQPPFWGSKGMQIDLKLSVTHNNRLSRKDFMNKGIPIGTGIGITVVIAAIAGNLLVQDNSEFVDTVTESHSSISQQDLKIMVENWMNNPDEDDTNQRLEIMKAYYTFEETGQKLTQDRDGLTLMNQIRKMVSLNIPKIELDQLRNEVRIELGLEPLFETKILYVDSKLVDCVGVGPQQCMLVRENSDSDWKMFYDNIEGFDYQEGTQYKIEVIITDVENPPADASSLKYTLVTVLETFDNNCGLAPDAGMCKAYMPKYYFDETSNSCQEFIWGGMWRNSSI